MRLAAVLALLLSLLIPKAYALLPGEAVNALIRIPLPAALDIGGEPVPLEREDVAERLDYELTIMLGNPTQTSLWLKRFPRFFPEIEKELKARGLPDDLKYVAVIESSLRADAVSSAGAVGPWQFMAATGRTYGLDRDSWMDERRDWARSTRAALDFLKELHDRSGSWALSLASYNCGPGRVRSAMESQRYGDFWGLLLPEETERYVFRFLAAKLIFTSPASFGIDLNQANLYTDRGLKPATFEVRRNKIPLLTLSKAAGLSYRYFLELNPFLTGGDLPRGTHTVYIPGDRHEQFHMALEAWKRSNPETPAKEKEKSKARPAKPVPVLTADPPNSAQQVQPPPPVPLPAANTQVLFSEPAAPAPGEAPAAATSPESAVSAPPEEAAPALPQPQADTAPEDPAKVLFAPKTAPASETYTVRKGDTITSIAKRLGVPAEKLKGENGIDASGAIRPGQVLTVPR